MKFIIPRASLSKSILFLPFLSFFIFSCSSETLRRQEETIQEQQAEIERQRKELAELEAAIKREGQKRQDCNRAFRHFEQGQTAPDPSQAVELYQKGLDLCPDDDVAHYELGKILAGMGRKEEAAGEFETALKLNPNFQEAREQLRTMGR